MIRIKYSLTVSETDDALREFACDWGSNFLGSCIDLHISVTGPFRALWWASGRRIVIIKIFMCHGIWFLKLFGIFYLTLVTGFSPFFTRSPTRKLFNTTNPYVLLSGRISMCHFITYHVWSFGKLGKLEIFHVTICVKQSFFKQFEFNFCILSWTCI